MQNSRGINKFLFFTFIICLSLRNDIKSEVGVSDHSINTAAGSATETRIYFILFYLLYDNDTDVCVGGNVDRQTIGNLMSTNLQTFVNSQMFVSSSFNE